MDFSGMSIAGGVSIVPPIPPNQQAIFGFGSVPVAPYSTAVTNLVSSTGVVATDTTGVGSARNALAASTYGTDKAIFGYGYIGAPVDNYTAITNKVSNTGVVATDTAGVGTIRQTLAAAGYGTDKGIFGFGGNGSSPFNLSTTNLVSNTGVVASDTPGVGTVRTYIAAATYGTDKAIFGFGQGVPGAVLAVTNLVSNTGVVATDTPGVGTARLSLGAAGYGTDKAIFGYGQISGGINTTLTNLVSNTGVVASDVTSAGTARQSPAAATYGGDKAIFGYGYAAAPLSSQVSMTNLVSSAGVVASDTTGVGTARSGAAASAYN